MEITVEEILRRKGTEVLTTDPDSTVFDAIARMVDHNVGSILVTDDGEVEGIFTERDYLRRIVLEGRTSKTTRVEEVMTTDVVWVDPSYTADECMALMTENKCRHLPVLSDNALSGIISIGDCVKQVSRTARSRVEELQKYISGRYPA
ncbi:MAG TPA: CBS domain-containing protein [Salinibacter sp.]|nr:CBS domain-containing protein [Salinibacter sp.]